MMCNKSNNSCHIRLHLIYQTYQHSVYKLLPEDFDRSGGFGGKTCFSIVGELAHGASP